MKNETKLKKVQRFLEENGIEYHLPKKRGKFGHSDLTIPKFGIYIKLDGDDSRAFYERHHRGWKQFPVFVRDSDTPKFVIEKVQNTIIKSMTLEQNALLKKKKH